MFRNLHRVVLIVFFVVLQAGTVGNLVGESSIDSREKLAISRLSSQELQRAIQQARADVAEIKRRGNEQREVFRLMDLERRLLLLGDPDVFQKLIESIRTEDVTSVGYNVAFQKLIYAARPEAVVELESLFSQSESLSYRPLASNPKVLVPPRSFSVARLVLTIVSRSLYFDPTVRQWAETSRGAEYGEVRRETLNWWMRNRVALKAGDYALVVPGAVIAKHSSNNSVPDMNAGSESSTEKQDLRPIEVSKGGQAEKSSDGYFVEVAVIALVAGGIAVAVRVRSRRKSESKI